MRTSIVRIFYLSPKQLRVPQAFLYLSDMYNKFYLWKGPSVNHCQLEEPSTNATGGFRAGELQRSTSSITDWPSTGRIGEPGIRGVHRGRQVWGSRRFLCAVWHHSLRVGTACCACVVRVTHRPTCCCRTCGVSVSYMSRGRVKYVGSVSPWYRQPGRTGSQTWLFGQMSCPCVSCYKVETFVVWTSGEVLEGGKVKT